MQGQKKSSGNQTNQLAPSNCPKTILRPNKTISSEVTLQRSSGAIQVLEKRDEHIINITIKAVGHNISQLDVKSKHSYIIKCTTNVIDRVGTDHIT